MSNSSKTIYVAAGSNHNLDKIINNPKYSRKIKETYKHPNYTYENFIKTGSGFSNDVALIKTISPFKFGEHRGTFPVCILDEDVTDFKFSRLFSAGQVE